MARKQTFIAKGLDQHGREMAVGKADWMATGGTIGKNAVHTAGPDEGSFLVTASVGDISGRATVEIAKEPRKKDKGDDKDKKDRGPRPLSWAGTVPSQKWMNSYTKVLARFATDKTLKLSVDFEVSPEPASAEHRTEDTKTALRELGLDDDVKTRESRAAHVQGDALPGTALLSARRR